MRSILIIQPWISYRGAETVSVQECLGLAKLGIRAEIAAVFIDRKRLPEGGDKVRYILPPKLISELCRKSKLAFIIIGPVSLFFLVLKLAPRFDVLNAHNLPSVWVAGLVSFITKVKVIWTAHTLESIVKFPVISSIDKLLVRKADVIVVPSTRLAIVIKKRYNRDSEIVVNPVANIRKKKILKDIKLKKFVSDHYPVLLQVGALNSQKGQMITLRVLKLIKSKYSKAGVVFVGEGPEADKLKVQSEKLKVNNDVLFAEYVPQGKLGDYYESCTINLLPSKNETFSGSALEALMFGKTSVVTNDNGVLEVVGEYLFKSEIIDRDIALNIFDYLANKKRIDARIEKAKAYIKSFMSPVSYAKRFLTSVNKAFFSSRP